LRAYQEFIDISEGGEVSVYSLNEFATEKVVALEDRAQNEPRDLYALRFLTAHAGVKLHLLLPAIEEKLRFRNKEIAGLQDRIVAKEARLKAL
jgi:predicted nucleotidyltransferase component of viral defense system